MKAALVKNRPEQEGWWKAYPMIYQRHAGPCVAGSEFIHRTDESEMPSHPRTPQEASRKAKIFTGKYSSVVTNNPNFYLEHLRGDMKHFTDIVRHVTSFYTKGDQSSV